MTINGRGWPLTEVTPDVLVVEQPLPSVLHVEDDAAIQRAIASILRRAGYEVTSVATAADAIAALGARRFDCVLSDFDLKAGGTGAEVLEVAELRATPFVFLTSDDRADRYGVLRLDKPCSNDAIRAAIRAITRRAA